jgi:hypothetical protein
MKTPYLDNLIEGLEDGQRKGINSYYLNCQLRELIDIKKQLNLHVVVKSLKDKEAPHFYDWLKENKVDFFDDLLLYKGDWLSIGDLYVKYKKEFKIPL